MALKFLASEHSTKPFPITHPDTLNGHSGCFHGCLGWLVTLSHFHGFDTLLSRFIAQIFFQHASPVLSSVWLPQIHIQPKAIHFLFCPFGAWESRDLSISLLFIVSLRPNAVLHLKPIQPCTHPVPVLFLTCYWFSDSV